ncbi:MAG: zinc-binding dehydrogenase [Gemmatimonadota bacterium]
MTQATVRAAIFPAPNEAVRLESYPLPPSSAGGAILETIFAEVCGTDVHLHHGRLRGVPYPLIPGHVSVGRLAELREPVNDVEGRPFREGDVVTFLDVHETCNACFQCLVAKQTTRCPHRKVYGVTYGAKDGLLGGWAERIWLKPGVKLVRLPPGLDPETFIGGGCGMVTALHAIDRAEIRLGQSVAVLGAGPVGQSCVAMAALSGASDIIVIGGPENRLEFARRMGATDAVSLATPHAERLEYVRSLTHGRGVDVVIEAAGRPEAVPQALDLVRDGGRVVVVGQYTDNGPVEINPHYQINRKHVEMRGCWGSDYSHFHRAVAIAAQHGHRVPWREMAQGKFSLADAAHALQAIESQSLLKAVIVP